VGSWPSAFGSVLIDLGSSSATEKRSDLRPVLATESDSRPGSALVSDSRPVLVTESALVSVSEKASE